MQAQGPKYNQRNVVEIILRNHWIMLIDAIDEHMDINKYTENNYMIAKK